MESWDVQSGLNLLNLGLVGVFFHLLVRRNTVDAGSSINRTTYINFAIFAALFFNWFLDVKNMAGNMRCSIYLSVVMVSPCLVVSPYFFMAMEQWGQGRKTKARWLPMRWFGQIVGETPKLWRAYLNITVSVLFYFGASALVILYRYKVIGEDVEQSDCSLGDQLWALITLFVINVLTGLFCLYLSFDCARSKTRCGSFLLWEQNLVFLWSLIFISVFFAFYLNPGVQEWATAQGFLNYELFIYLNNLGPILFSGVLPFILGFCDAHVLIRGTLSVKKIKENLMVMRKEANRYETVELETMTGSESGSDEFTEALRARENFLNPSDQGRFTSKPPLVSEEALSAPPDSKNEESLVWFFLHKDTLDSISEDGLERFRGREDGRSNMQILLDIRNKLEHIRSAGKGMDGVRGLLGTQFVSKEFPQLHLKLAGIQDEKKKFNLLFLHVCRLCAAEAVAHIDMKEVATSFKNNQSGPSKNAGKPESEQEPELFSDDEDPPKKR